MSKRKRCENWSENEKFSLFALLEEKVQIIECKKTDSNTNKKKISAWREIEEKFNMIFTTNRSANQLKEQWKRMKVAARKHIAYYKKNQNATGGGTNNFEVSEMDWRIHSLLPHEFFKDSNTFDNDHDNNDIDTQSQDQVIVEEIEHQALVHHEENTDDNNDFICPIELGHVSEEHSYSIIGDVNMSEDNNTQNIIAQPDNNNNNISQAFLINTTSAECGTDISMTPRRDNFIQSNSNTLAERVADTRTPRNGNISLAAINTPVHTRTTQSLAHANTERRGSNTIQTPLRHDVNLTQGSSRWSRTSVRSSRTRNMASESAYHQLLVERKSEEYDLKFKQMKEIHELELKKRKIEIETLLLAKEKIQLEIEIIKKQ